MTWLQMVILAIAVLATLWWGAVWTGAVASVLDEKGIFKDFFPKENAGTWFLLPIYITVGLLGPVFFLAAIIAPWNPARYGAAPPPERKEAKLERSFDDV
jgi:hypothetical protein